MQPNQESFCSAVMSRTVADNNKKMRACFFLKHCEDLRDAYPYVLHLCELTDEDLDLFLEGDPKPNCNRCQWCFLLALCNVAGFYLPPTPSPYFMLVPKYPELGTAASHTSATERQYTVLYRDFNHASLIELRDKISSGERNQKLGLDADEKIIQVIHSFTSKVFSILLDEYLELFEEMVKGVILFKESGITLEDICSVDEDGGSNHCQQANCTRNMYRDLSSSRPYEAAEFEKQLLDELIKQYNSYKKIDSEMPREADHQTNNRESQACDCEHATKRDNPYLAYLTQIKRYSPSSENTEQFAETLQTEKQMFLKSCLNLLRDSNYFRSSIELCSEIECLIDRETQGETNSPNWRKQEDIDDGELFNISVAIYNQTVWHVQSTIFAIFRSLQKDELYKKRLLPSTPQTFKFNKFSKGLKYDRIDDIQKSLSCYFKETDVSAFEDEVFTQGSGSFYIDSTGQDDSNKGYFKHDECDKRIQALPSIKYEKEIKYRHEQHQYGLNQELRVRGPQQENMLQHPNLEYVEDVRRQIHNSNHLTLNIQKNTTAQTGFPPHNFNKNDFSRPNTEQRNTAERPDNALIFADKTVFLQPNQQEREISLFKKTIIGKKKHASVICIFNYYKPEVSHNDAIAFIERIKMEGGVLHYPHCSDNTSMTKIDGPSFYFTECCVDCRQELAPPQKLEAFKTEPKYNNKFKIISQILRKTRASFYFPVQCGSCSFFVCDPQKAKKRRHLFVPFHSAVKSRICSSRLKSHKCEFVLSAHEYTGCRSDTINKPNTKKPCLSRDHLNKSQNHKYLYRSRSVPLLAHRKDDGSRGILDSDDVAARKNASLNFEDAVANILNIWTYEMINYEEGVNSPHIRSQIMNYRKSISVFIKKDLKEKLCYRHILSVFKRVENYESPILEFKDRDSIQKNMIVKKSQSCHAKLKYEASSVIHLSDNVSLEYNNNISSLQKIDQPIGSENSVGHLRSGALKRKNILTPLSLNLQLVPKPSKPQRRRSYSFSESVYKDDFSTQMNSWKNELQELQKSIESPDMRSVSQNRKIIARPVSLHSGFRQKTLTAARRRRSSCSFATEIYKDYSTPITAWKNELLKLENNVGSPTLRSETRKNTARPLSLNTELNKKPLATQRRRSYSLAESTPKEDYSTQMNAWKNELLKLQNSAQSPHLGALSMNRKNLVRPHSLHSNLEQRTPGTQRRRSCSFTESACKEAVSTQMNAWEKELKALQKSADSPNLRFGAIDLNNKCLRPEPKRVNTTETHRPKSESFINEFSFEINKSKLELLKLQKSVEDQHLRAEIKHRNNIKKAASLHSDPEHTVAASYRRQSESVINKKASSELNEWRNELIKLQKSVESPQSNSEIARRKINEKAGSSGPKERADVAAMCPKSELDDTLTELKTWNLKLRELERDAIRPYLRQKQIKRKNKARAVSLNTEPKRTTTFTTIRPKSESVLDDYSAELETWKHELLTLEEDAKNPQHDDTLIPQHEALACKSIAKSRSMNLELKYKNVGHGINFESTRINNKDDTSRTKPRLTRMLPLDQNIKNKIPTQNKSPVRRYSATPRQLPAIPNDRNMRRHSHYEITENFVNLLSSKKATHLNTQARNPVSPNDPDTNANHRIEASGRYLGPEENVSRSRFFSQ